MQWNFASCEIHRMNCMCCVSLYSFMLLLTSLQHIAAIKFGRPEKQYLKARASWDHAAQCVLKILSKQVIFDGGYMEIYGIREYTMSISYDPRISLSLQQETDPPQRTVGPVLLAAYDLGMSRHPISFSYQMIAEKLMDKQKLTHVAGSLWLMSVVLDSCPLEPRYKCSHIGPRVKEVCLRWTVTKLGQCQGWMDDRDPQSPRNLSIWEFPKIPTCHI